MLRGTKRKETGGKSGSGGVSSTSPSKRVKEEAKKEEKEAKRDVVDIEELPAFIAHKDATHQWKAKEIEGIRENLLKVCSCSLSFL